MATSSLNKTMFVKDNASRIVHVAILRIYKARILLSYEYKHQFPLLLVVFNGKDMLPPVHVKSAVNYTYFISGMRCEIVIL